MVLKGTQFCTVMAVHASVMQIEHTFSLCRPDSSKNPGAGAAHGTDYGEEPELQQCWNLALQLSLPQNGEMHVMQYYEAHRCCPEIGMWIHMRRVSRVQSLPTGC